MTRPVVEPATGREYARLEPQVPGRFFVTCQCGWQSTDPRYGLTYHVNHGCTLKRRPAERVTDADLGVEVAPVERRPPRMFIAGVRDESWLARKRGFI